MGMRIVWGLHDDNFAGQLVALFEAENLLDGYRDYCLRKWYDEQTVPLPLDVLPDEDQEARAGYEANRLDLINKGYDAWRADQIYTSYPRFRKEKYELWNSVPPNVERLVMHFDS